MEQRQVGEVAVIFASRRNGADRAGYDAAAVAMDALAARQPGYRGVESVRDADGAGITVETEGEVHDEPEGEVVALFEFEA